MKKLFAFILAVMMTATMSTTAFAATNEGGNTTINVKGTYEGAQGAGDKISVDVAWEGMEFTYTEASEGTWDPTTHSYKDTAAGSWSTNKGTITVTNHSNVAVTATLGFTSAVDGVIGTFTETSGTENDSVLALDTAVGTEVANAPKAAAQFGISGAAITETKDTLGTITVTIAKAN